MRVTSTTLPDVWKASSSVRYLFTTVTLFLKSFFIPGLYSGIFAFHLQIYVKEADSRKKNIVFHALWVLYLLSAAEIAVDIASFVVFEIVSDNECLLFLVTVRVLISFAET